MAQRKTTDLHKKILCKDWTAVKHYVANHPEWMGCKDEAEGLIPLSYALVKKEVPEEILFFLTNNMPKDLLNDQSDGGETALMLACGKGEVECARLLINANASINVQTNDGLTALMTACANRQFECARLLLDANAGINVETNDGFTALMIACGKGEVECVRLLIAANAGINVQTNSGETALMLACGKGEVECARLLINANAGINVQTNDGLTALMLACANRQFECARLLIDANAGINVETNDGLTALMSACAKGQVQCARLLLDSNAGINLQTNDGYTALMTACENGQVECARLLLDTKAGINIHTNSGFTALMIACEKGKVECARLLLHAKADINVQANQGATALIIACQNGHVECAELLIEASADINVKTNDGSTPLHSCFLRPDGTYAEHLSVSIVLLKHDRSMAFVKNNDGHSAVDMYQRHECKAYSDETRSAQKEELLIVLKGRIPRDIMLKDQDTVLTFLKDLKEGYEIFEKCSVTVVGQARVGKTSLIKRLTGQRFNPEEEETDGIVITKTFTIDENERKWKQSGGKTLTAEGLSLKIYDFAGQEKYYTTHQVFVMSRSVFLLVFNLSLDLNAKALMEIRGEHRLKNFPKFIVKAATFLGWKSNTKVYELDMTNLDFINYWLSSIYAHTVENKQKDGTQAELLSPPLFMVGTHANSLPGDESQRKAKIEETFNIIRGILNGKPYKGHVVIRFYAVDSSLRYDEEIQKLRSHILEVVQEQPYMNELVPTSWMGFGRALEEKRQVNAHWIGKKEVSEIATRCEVTDSALPKLLQFLHDTGNCVYFGNKDNVDDPLNLHIILNQMWLNDIFTRVMTFKSAQQQHARFKDSWVKLESHGLLDEKLAKHVWREFTIDINVLFGLMSRFDLLCEMQFPDEESASRLANETRVFWVPCCLSETTKDPAKIEVDNCTVRFLVDFAGFLPSGLFFRLMVHALRFSQECGGRHQRLSRHSAEFYVEREHNLILRIFSKDRTFMEVIIVCLREDGTEPSKAVCQKVVMFLMGALTDLCTIWSKGVKFTYGIECHQCHDETDKPHLHTFDECKSELGVACKGRCLNTERFQHLFVKGLDRVYVQQTNNFQALRSLVTDLGTKEMRKFFLSQVDVDEADVGQFLIHEKQNGRFKGVKFFAEQKQKMFTTDADINNFDITMMMVLIRHCCGVSCPDNFWTKPDEQDNSELANLVRIREYRNKLAHNHNGRILTNEFKEEWKKLTAIFQGVGVANDDIDKFLQLIY